MNKVKIDNKILTMIQFFFIIFFSINLIFTNTTNAKDDVPVSELELLIYIHYPNLCGNDIFVHATAKGGVPDYDFVIYFGEFSSTITAYDTSSINAEHTYSLSLMGDSISIIGGVRDSEGNTDFKGNVIWLRSCEDPPNPPDDNDNDSIPPELIWSPSFIDFGDMLPGQSRYEILSVYNNGTGNINYSFLWDSNWFNIMPWNGSVSNPLVENIHIVTINTTDLSLGEHNGFIYINYSPIPVRVNVVEEIPAPELIINSNSYDLGTLYKGQISTASFDLWNNGEGRLEYGFNILEDSVSVYENNIRSGSSTGEHHTIYVEVDTKNLSVGSHNIEIIVKSNGGNDTFNLIFNVYSELDLLKFSKPISGSLYLHGRRLIKLPFLYDLSLIFGSITIEVDDSDFDFGFVEFWFDDKLVNTSYEKPYCYKIEEKIFGLHKIFVKGFDIEGYLVDTCEKEFLIYNRGHD